MGANSSVAAAGPHSLDADVILKLHEAPLFSVEGYAFSAGAVIITGTALPMSGGSDAVRLVSEPGVKATFEAGLPSPNATATYWYLADAARSAFRITVDLAGTWHGGDYYRFGLRFAGSAEDAAEVIRTGFLVPKSLSLLENYPSQDALQRVMRFETIGGVAINGASDADRILRLAEMHGFDRRTGTVLDWGVRHGRVLRFFRPLGAGRALHGIDNDPANTTWASEHLPDLKITLGPPMPPMPYADASFDLLYGISVMTHLSEEVQRAWLAEIDRVLRPGGLALLTFAGDTTVAFGSRYLDRAWLDKYLSTGRGPDLPDKSLVGIIADPSYYKNVNVTLPKVVELCSGYLEVAAAYPCMFGYQDLVVLRSRAMQDRTSAVSANASQAAISSLPPGQSASSAVTRSSPCLSFRPSAGASQIAESRLLASARTAVLVLGMHRSGTSVLTHLIGKLGLALPMDPNPAASDNPEGYWEPAGIVQLHDELLKEVDSSWLDTRPLSLAALSDEVRKMFSTRLSTALAHSFGNASCFVLKDPRICRMVPFYRQLFSQAQTRLKVVIVVRDPAEVAESLYVRNQISPSYTAYLWARHLMDAERHTRDLPRIVVQYDSLVNDWCTVADAILGFLRNEVPRADLADLASPVRPELRNHHTSGQVLFQEPIGGLLREVQAAILDATADPVGSWTRLDNLAEEMAAAAARQEAALEAEFCFQRLTSPYASTSAPIPLLERQRLSAAMGRLHLGAVAGCVKRA